MIVVGCTKLKDIWVLYASVCYVYVCTLTYFVDYFRDYG